ncbi:unnamed protein product [Prunus brigantina]
MRDRVLLRVPVWRPAFAKPDGSLVTLGNGLCNNPSASNAILRSLTYPRDAVGYKAKTNEEIRGY